MPGRGGLSCALAACLGLAAAAPAGAAPRDQPPPAEDETAGGEVSTPPAAEGPASEGEPEPAGTAEDVAVPPVPQGEGPAATGEPTAAGESGEAAPPSHAATEDGARGPRAPGGASGAPGEETPPPAGPAGTVEELGPGEVPEAQLAWDRPIICLSDDRGEPVMRIQCPERVRSGDETVCLYSGGFETREDGGRGPHLERTRACDAYHTVPPERLEQFLADHLPVPYRLRPAVAEAPPGWQRDARGRVFQVNFDLNRRVYLGARWVPVLLPADGMELGRVGLELGTRLEYLSDDLRTRYRFQILTGEVMLNPLGAAAVLLRFDASHDNDEPLLRITTFWPEPARHDLHADIGGWLDVLAVEHAPRNSFDETQMRFVAGGFTWDFWHSADMYSYVRLRAGGAFDDLYLDRGGTDNRVALTPVAAVEGDFTLDDDGFHHLTFVSSYEAPFVWRSDADGPPSFTQRFQNELAYEVIFLAINDQPLTFRVAAGGGYRDDVEPAASGWGLTAGAGLRFSFWAPARDIEALRAARMRGRE